MENPRRTSFTMNENRTLEADFNRCPGYRNPSPEPDGYTPAAVSWQEDFLNADCHYEPLDTFRWYRPLESFREVGPGVPEAWAVMLPQTDFSSAATLYDWSDRSQEVTRSPENNSWGGGMNAVEIQMNQRDGGDDWVLFEHTDDVFETYTSVVTKCGRPALRDGTQMTVNFDADHACTREWLSAVWTNEINSPQFVQDLIFPVPGDWSSIFDDIHIEVHEVSGYDISNVRLCLYRAPFQSEPDAVACKESMDGVNRSSLKVNLDDAVSQVRGLYMVEVGTEPTTFGDSPPEGYVVISISSE